MLEKKIKLIIDKAKNGMNEKKSIKDEIKTLTIIYDYMDEEEDKELIDLIIKDLSILQEYQSEYEKAKIEKIQKRLKIHRFNEYKMLWGEKTFFYKIFHRNMDPDNVNLSELVLDDVNSLIDKLSSETKKQSK